MRRALRGLAARWAIDTGSQLDELSTDRGERGGRMRRLWSRVMPYLGPSRPIVLLLASVSLVGSVAEAGLLYLVVQIAARMADHADALDVSIGPLSTTLTLTASMWFAAGCLAVTAALNVLAALLVTRLTVSSLNRARRRMMNAFLHAGWAEQSLERTGRLQELLSTNTMRISQAVLMISNGITAGISFLVLLLSALAIQPVAAGIILLGVIGTGALLVPLSRMTKRMSTRHKTQNAGYASRVTETVDLARDINVFGVWDRVEVAMERRANNVSRLHFATRLLSNVNPVVYRLTVLGLLLLGLAGVRAAGSANISALGAVVILLVRALSYGQQINTAMQQASEITPYVADIASQEQAYRRARPDDGDIDLTGLHSITFEGVHYAYEPSTPVLVDVGFDVRPGEVIGIVGPSGGGKSTLVQLILRLRRPTAGRHLVDGIDAHRYTNRSWTQRFAHVPQDNRLFLGSVADNIRFFRPDVDDDAVVEAATLAHLHPEIVAMPDGYDAVVGAGATDLSGGQRQRLGLARALVGRPDVLVLDEPTSALDLHAETLVQRTLEDLRGRLTMFIVAHRLTTLSLCDRIIVIEDGRITGFGTYEELRRSNAFFRGAVDLSQLPA